MAKKAVKKAKKKVAVKKKATVAKKKVKKAAPKKKSATKRKSGLSQTTYSLSSELEAIVGEKKATRPQIVKQIWVYIKKHNLQDSRNRRMINPDHKLAEVIGKKPVDMLKLAGFLNKHIK